MSILKNFNIASLKEFYLKKFFTLESFDYIERGQDFRHDLDMSKFHWVFSNIPEGSKVLDLGCGCGNLNFLKKKSCQIVGLDISPLNSKRAIENGYDYAICGNLTNLPFQSEAFDVVLSLDVIGHIAFNEKDLCISEIKRVLKPTGITLHGIESDQVNYDSLSKKELKQFVEVDGHIGMEGQKENEHRFSKHFKYVESQFQFNIPMTVSEIKKQSIEYPMKFQIDPYLLNRLKKFDNQEKYVWNLAMGFVFERIMKFRPAIKDTWGFLLLRAGNLNMSADNFGIPEISKYLKPVSIGSRNDLYHILDGFYNPEGDSSLENSYRWIGSEAQILVPYAKNYRLCIGASRLEGANEAEFEISIQGEKKIKLKSSEEKMIIDIKGPDLQKTDNVIITFESNTFIPEELSDQQNKISDQRKLGIRIYWIDWT